MSKVITLRSDPAIEEALQQLGATSGTRSRIVREAVLETARRHQDELLEQEAKRLAADPADLAEVTAVQEDMGAGRAW